MNAAEPATQPETTALALVRNARSAYVKLLDEKSAAYEVRHRELRNKLDAEYGVPLSVSLSVFYEMQARAYQEGFSADDIEAAVSPKDSPEEPHYV